MEYGMLENLTMFPTAILSFLLCLGFAMMIISILSGMEIDFDLDTDIDGNNTSVAIGKVMVISGLSKIPLMIGLTVTFFFSTIISYFGQTLIFSFIEPGSLIAYIVGTVLLLLSFFISLFIAGFLLKPLEGLFDQNATRATFDFINKKCTVTSLSVSETFGEALVKDGSSEYLINVHSDDELKKGDIAIIIKEDDYNDDYKKYLIKKIKH